MALGMLSTHATKFLVSGRYVTAAISGNAKAICQNRGCREGMGMGSKALLSPSGAPMNQAPQAPLSHQGQQIAELL